MPQGPSTPRRGQCTGSCCRGRGRWTTSSLWRRARLRATRMPPTRPGATPQLSVPGARCACLSVSLSHHFQLIRYLALIGSQHPASSITSNHSHRNCVPRSQDHPGYAPALSPPKPPDLLALAGSLMSGDFWLVDCPALGDLFLWPCRYSARLMSIQAWCMQSLTMQRLRRCGSTCRSHSRSDTTFILWWIRRRKRARGHHSPEGNHSNS